MIRRAAWWVWNLPNIAFVATFLTLSAVGWFFGTITLLTVLICLLCLVVINQERRLGEQERRSIRFHRRLRRAEHHFPLTERRPDDLEQF